VWPLSLESWKSIVRMIMSPTCKKRLTLISLHIRLLLVLSLPDLTQLLTYSGDDFNP